MTLEDLYTRYNDKPIVSYKEELKNIDFSDLPSNLFKVFFSNLKNFCISLDNLFKDLRFSKDYYPFPNKNEILPVYQAAREVYKAKSLLNLLDQSDHKDKLLNFLQFFTDLIEEELYGVFRDLLDDHDVDLLDSDLDFANDCKARSFLG